MTHTIRPAVVSDAPAIAALLQELGWSARLVALAPEAASAQVARHLAANLADRSHTLLVAERAGVALGYVAAHWLPYLFMSGPEGFISELFVATAARGTGLGSALLDAIIAAARERGCQRLQLINFRERELYQRGFYRKAGWEERPDGASFVYTL